MFRGAIVFFRYFCDMHHTLFPDFSPLEMMLDQQAAQRIADRLRSVELRFFATHPEWRTVLRRLAEKGVCNAWDLLNIHRDEVAEWPGVGRVFLHLLDEMRAEVQQRPQWVIQTWRNEMAQLTLPDDLEKPSDEPTLFGEWEVAEVNIKEKAYSEEEQLVQDIIEVERTFVELIRLLSHRFPVEGAILRRYFLESLPLNTIVKVEHLSSRSTIHRLLEPRFLRPLRAGENICGITLSCDFRERMQKLEQRLRFRPAQILEHLNTMSPDRFLALMGLTLMRRTVLENLWACDFIVARQEVVRSRRTLHHTLLYLQFRPDFTARENIENHLSSILPSRDLVMPLLLNHPWVESAETGYRLVAEQLVFDFCRVGRILLDAATPLTKDEVISAYEHRYLERPLSLSLRLLRRHYPQILSHRRGVWTWGETEENETPRPKAPIQLTLFD